MNLKKHRRLDFVIETECVVEHYLHVYVHKRSCQQSYITALFMKIFLEHIF